MDVVLVHPDIPWNTGNIGRTCVAAKTPLHLVKPLGFEIDDKWVRRAGLDYWNHLDLKLHDSWEAFLRCASARYGVSIFPRPLQSSSLRACANRPKPN